jgi:hypothetical protein
MSTPHDDRDSGFTRTGDPGKRGEVTAGSPPVAAPSSLALQRRLLASSEWRVVARIDTFARSVRLLEANAEELRRAVHYLTQDPRSLLLQAIDAKEERDRWLNEAGRLLHNVLAAVKTLVDHTNALHKELYPSGDKFQDYTVRKKALGEAPLVRFVQELRNLHLHWKLPDIVYADRPGPDHTRTRHIVLARDELLMWDGWTARARSFLLDAPEDVEIAPVIDQYVNLIRNFYQWFAERLEEVHAADYASVNNQLAALRRADAPHVFASLRESAALVEDGSVSIAAALERWMLEDDKRMLELLRTESLSSWVEGALHRIGETYGEVPRDIITRLLEVARRSKPTG